MEPKKKRGRPKKTISEFACGKVSGKANPRNPEVFVLPPEILRQLGIHLNKQIESSNQNVSLSHHAGQGQLAPIQTSRKNEACIHEMKIKKINNDTSDVTSYKIPKRIDKVESITEPKNSTPPFAKPSTSIMETANLMKASLFLSPTFSQVNSNKSSVVESSLEIKHISDNINDSATTSIIDGLPDVSISGLSIGGLNEVLNSAVDLVSEETHFKDPSLVIDNGSNYALEYGDDIVSSVSKENIINTEENVTVENHREIIEGNRVCSENIEFLKEIQEMSDENILLEIYDMSKTNLSDNNVTDCNILESPYELDNPQICIRATSNIPNEYNQDVSKFIADSNFLETTQDISESKYDTEGSRDSNITVGREDYIFTNVPYVTSTPMINASETDMDIESDSMEDSNNFVETCLSNDNTTITANTLTDVTVTSNVDFFDIQSENKDDDSSTITAETTLSVVEALGHIQNINSNNYINPNVSQNLRNQENLMGPCIDTPSQLIDPNVSIESKESPYRRNKKKVNIISETIIKSAVHNEIISQFMNKVFTSNASKSSVSLDHNILLAHESNVNLNVLNKFNSPRKDCEAMYNFDEVKQNVVIEKCSNLKYNQPSGEIVLCSPCSKSDNEIDLVKQFEPTKKFHSTAQLSGIYANDEIIYGSPRKYVPVKDNVHVKSSPVEPGIFLDNRPSYNLGNLKSCPKSNKICVVSPLNIFSKKDNVRNSYNSPDTFKKMSQKYDNEKIYRQDSKSSELKTAAEQLENSPKLSDSVIEMLLDSPPCHETLTNNIEVTKVIPAYVHTSSTIADPSDVADTVLNLNSKDSEKIVASNDNINSLTKKVCVKKCEISSRTKSPHGKKNKDSKMFNDLNQTFDPNPGKILVRVDEKCSTSRLMSENIMNMNSMCSKRNANCKQIKSDVPSPSTTDAQVALIAKYIKAAVQACEQKATSQNNMRKHTIKNEDKTLIKNYKCYPSRKILNTHGVEKPGGNLSTKIKLNKRELEKNCSRLKTSNVEVHLFEDTLNKKTTEHINFEYPEEIGISADNDFNSSNISSGSQGTKELIDVSNFGSVSYNTVDSFITKNNVNVVDESVGVYVIIGKTADETRETIAATDKDSDMSEAQIKTSLPISHCQSNDTIKKSCIKLAKKDVGDQTKNFEKCDRSDRLIAISNSVSCEPGQEKNLDSQDAAIKINNNTSEFDDVTGDVLHFNIENSLSDLGAATQCVSAEVFKLCNERSIGSERIRTTDVSISNPKGAFKRSDSSNYSLHISEQGLNSRLHIEVSDENFGCKEENKDVGEAINIQKTHSLENIHFLRDVEEESPHKLHKQMEGPLIELKSFDPSSAAEECHKMSNCQDIKINEVFDTAAKNKLIVEQHTNFSESMHNQQQVSSNAEIVAESSCFYKVITNKHVDILHSDKTVRKSVDENKDSDDAIYSKTADSKETFRFENYSGNNEQMEVTKCNSDNELDNELSNDAHSDNEITDLESVIDNINGVEKDIPVQARNLSYSMKRKSLELTKTVGLHCTNSRDLSVEINNQDKETHCKLDIINQICVSAGSTNKIMIDSCAQKMSPGLSSYDINEGNQSQSTEKGNKEIKFYNSKLSEADNNKIIPDSLSSLIRQSNEKSEHEQTIEKVKPFKKRDRNNEILIQIEDNHIKQSQTSYVFQHENTEDHLPATTEQGVGSSVNNFDSKIVELGNFVQAEVIDMLDEHKTGLTVEVQTLLTNEVTSKAICSIESGIQTPIVPENPANIAAIKRKRGRPKKEATELVTSTVGTSKLNFNEPKDSTHTASLHSSSAQENTDKGKGTVEMESNSSPILKKRGRPKKNVTIPSSSTEKHILNSPFKSAVGTRTEHLYNELDNNQKKPNQDGVSIGIKESIETFASQNQSSGRKRGRPKKIISELKQLQETEGQTRRSFHKSTRSVKKSSLTEKGALSDTQEISIDTSNLEYPAYDIKSERSMKEDKYSSSNTVVHKEFKESLETLLQTEDKNKRSRKKTNFLDESGVANMKYSLPTEESREETQITKRHRKRIVYSDDEFESPTDAAETQHTKRQKKSVDHSCSATAELCDELAKKTVEKSAFQEVTVKCGLCEVEMKSNLWCQHSAKEHNYLAHRSGEDPINLKDSKLVIKLFGQIHKQLLKDFKCKICGLVRSSATGFYTHIVSCQNGESTPSRKSKKLVYAEPEVPTSANVKCAVCSAEMPNNKWSQHLLSVHNNLAWFEGAQSIDLQNEKVVLAILIRVAKDAQSITCHKCGATRASALGFITHMAVCQKTEEEIENMKIKCEVCQKAFMPSAMRAHMNAHKLFEVTVEEDLQSRILTDSGGKRKRAAAKVAESSFANLDIDTMEENIDWKVYYKEPFNGRAHKISIHRWRSNVNNNKVNRCYHIGCKYRDDTVEGIKKHYEEKCPFINKDYQCRRCKFRTDTFELIKKHALDKHVKKAHAGSDSDTQVPVAESDGEDEDEDQSDDDHAKLARDELDDKIVVKIGKMRPVKPMVPKLILNWTKRLYEIHLSKEPMFMQLTCQPVLHLSISDVLQYLPITQESCRICNLDFVVNLTKRKETFTEWRKYQLFESTVYNGAVTMFCGGPIQCMAWAPTRDLTTQDAHDQLLGISIHKDFSEEGYPSLTSCSHLNMLQFWVFRSLSNEKKCDQPAQFALGLCHEYGVVWDMAWCPSGGHMEGTNGIPARIGLLSVACSNGLAYIFAIQDPTELGESERKFYKTTPVIELRLDIRCNQRLNYQATSITWSIERGHNVIAVGYSHGYVALFDLTIESPFLRTVESGITIIGPYYNSPDMLSPVTGLTIYPRKQEEFRAEEGIILGAGSTAGAGLWSRYGTSNQTCLTHKKVNVTATFCVPHWPNLVCSLDNSSAKIGSVELALRSLSWEQQRNEDAASQRVLSSAAACLSVHSCWWSGLAMQSTGSGKLLVLPTLHPSYYASRPRTQILAEYDLVTLKDKQPASDASLDTYNAAVKDHGVVIREYGFDSNMPAKLAPHVNKAPRFSCESYNLTNVTSISINPSASTCFFVARGLQCGILHVAPVRKLS